MIKLMLKLEDMCGLEGVTVIFSHHTPKGNQEGRRTIDMAAGAGALGRFVDTALVTRNLDDNHRFSLQIVYRYGKAPDVVGLIMTGPNACLDPEFNKAEITTAGKYSNGPILSILAEKPIRVKELQEAVEAKTGMSRSTFTSTYWPAVKDVPGVTQDDEGLWTYVKPIPETITATS